MYTHSLGTTMLSPNFITVTYLARACCSKLLHLPAGTSGKRPANVSPPRFLHSRNPNSVLPFPFLSLVEILLSSLFTLNLRNKPPILLLIGSILLLLLTQTLSSNEIRVLAKFTECSLALTLVLLLQASGLTTLLVGIIVLIGVEGLFEFGKVGFDGKWTVVVEELGTPFGSREREAGMKVLQGSGLCSRFEGCDKRCEDLDEGRGYAPEIGGCENISRMSG